ncbi:Multidrug resistance protein [Exophiala xenobiotica]|uniref:Multidrug resistance protein n=1 Tax=Vermiconidia calcicola TaxID=1690605 RepID=A0AAV9PT19_9PEZI|nr:Multidrug resistance protein [Exophiala xenobiotica]KAK5528254.1 Multidrug resistance protein [Vermiconidia calcicola]KAK5534144.1 Multidrug resistance protein [Chaetothyriales sp. CCFEE 6169]KAK5303233.1 Multidrug resistance protein [Exophiala xenobiotica]KAK5333355.1 Multidrug resistance protein [Exophiala xenobiotica]
MSMAFGNFGLNGHLDPSSPERAVQEEGTDEVQPDTGESESMETRHSIVKELARSYTKDSGSNSESKAIFESSDLDSPLNPRGEKFNARAWATNVAKVASERDQQFRQVGLCFQNLNVFGYGTPTDFQKDVGNVWLALPGMTRRLLTSRGGQTRIDILRQFDGLIRPGEMCVVLGPPGSGCSTFLKTVAGETNGLYVSEGSYFNYQGMSAKEMHTAHRGDAIYTAEVDVHFPKLTVGETLTFASRARCQRELPPGIDRDQYCEHLRDVVMAMYGITHTLQTKVGDQYVRGVSGGERKRVTIAEATLANAPFQCWDNSTRGLDSANAIEFCKTLRLQSEVFGQTCVVSMYQAPQSAYDQFDKVTVLYEGRQIYFGSASTAKKYFETLGFECPARQTTPDFLTSMTFSAERVIRPGYNPPRTPDEFATAWKSSPQYRTLLSEIDEYKKQHPFDGPDAETFRHLKKAHQAKGQRVKSPYTLTYSQQVQLCIWRGFRRLKADPSLTLTMGIGNTIMALIISSLYFNLSTDTNSFYGRSVVLFVAILFNAFASMLEILTLYAQRPIVEKQTRYAFYHPSAESYASVLVDLPAKIVSCICFNIVFYFMTNLNREPGAFFYYLLVTFLIIMAMSGIFRSVASVSRTEQQAMVPAAVLMLALLIFTGFVVPVDYMPGWCRWINYVDPVAFGYESLMVNEFHGRNFTCSTYIPDYANASANNIACDAIGASPGQSYVNGDYYLSSAYSYEHGHKWRNVGIIVAMVIFNHLVYFTASEYVTAKKSKGEVLVFRRGGVPGSSLKGMKNDVEKSLSGPVPVVANANGYTSSDEKGTFRGSTSVFHWNNVCYDIKIKKETRHLLDHVDGWVKPGTLTALMGVSGAGKTTLLDCLADRRTGVGVLTGEILVDGKIRDESFQRKTGYAQQQDLHLETSTVREALKFSALLRQPAGIPKAEKLAYVDEVIKLLDMQEYADAVVGVLGEGLNVEQRNRLTIGVELAAKPPLLLFVDEPTSGLDSQTSWAILDLLEKLSKAGQSILCTIHQPSAMLFQRFDRLLLLQEGGQTVYFGEIGDNSKTLTDYFERKGASPCPSGANPAEWMLEAIGAAPGSSFEIDWHQAWRSGPEYQAVQDELARLRASTAERPSIEEEHDLASYREFATPLWQQFLVVIERVFQQYWRTPTYIYSKICLCITASLFVGLVFVNAPLSIQGLQNQMFAIFELSSIFGQLVEQQMPHFVTQRSLYEVRERPAKTYSWKIFMLSQIIAEIPWNTLASVFMWAFMYYPVGFYKNADAAGQGTERGVLMWLLFWVFMLFACTFAHMCISFADTADEGGNNANFLFILIFFFCGVLATKDQMPGFWVFLYRVSPLSYWVSAVLATGLANVDVTCAKNEYITLNPPTGQVCGEYMADYISRAGGYLLDPSATSDCKFCKIKDTNVYLAGIGAHYEDRWRNFGLMWAYVAFNVVAALALYWLVRMPKGKRKL